MSGVEAGTGLFVLLLAMIALRVPIGLAMLLAGMIGYAGLNGWLPLIAYLKTAPYYRFSTYELSVIPLFLLMGQFATQAGLSRALFESANRLFGRLRGGIAMAAVGGCAAFGAICGSSLATAATMGQVALPELSRYRYSGALATGALAAGGTLGILIPPSVVLVIYALLTEQSIGKMFMAAVVPGIVAAAGYIAAIAVYVRLRPGAAPPPAAGMLAVSRASVGMAIAVLVIFVVVIGGIYSGRFTPTEGAAVGAFLTGAMAIWPGRMGGRGLVASLLGAAQASAMIFLILFGAEVFNAALALTQMPQQAARAVAESGWSPMLVLGAMLLLYLVFGCVMDSLSMILLTIPVFFPVISALDFGLGAEETAIWFGVLALIVVEVGLITPPVGLNVFIINGIAREVPITETYRGVMPFLATDAVRVALLVAFPAITLALPRLLE
ncbi:MAG TPA: TRAP transporter large permease [Alphaproteobacteria bacterium]